MNRQDLRRERARRRQETLKADIAAEDFALMLRRIAKGRAFTKEEIHGLIQRHGYWPSPLREEESEEAS